MSRAVLVLSDVVDATLRLLIGGFERRGAGVRVASPLDLALGERLTLHGERIDEVDAAMLYCPVAPRPHRDAVLRLEQLHGAHLEARGVRCINPPDARRRALDKPRAVQRLLRAGLPMPATIVAWDADAAGRAIERELGLPVVLKLPEGCKGLGVTRADSIEQARAAVAAAQAAGHPLIVQRYVAESAGRSLRAMVVGKRVVAAFERFAPPGDFRTNMALGGRQQRVKLAPEAEALAVAGAAALGLELSGVDLVESGRGPLLLEANSRPGLASLVETGAEIVGPIVDLALGLA